MKHFGKSISIFLCISLLMSVICIIPTEAKTQIDNGNLYVLSKWDVEELEFELDNPCVLYFEFDLSLDYISNGKDYVKVELDGITYDDEEMEEISTFNEKFTIKFLKGHDTFNYWYFPDEELPAGYYTLYFQSNSDVNIKYNITSYKSFSEEVTIPKNLKLKTDTEKYFEMENITPSGALIGSCWESSNRKIAEVYNDGRSKKVYVYGVKAGKCTLTCKLENGKKYKCNVTVKDPSKPKISLKKLFIDKGDKYKLQLKFTKQKKVTWSSSNPKIATVNEKGQVKAIAEGRCEIIAKCGGKQYKCSVRVYRNYPNFVAYPTSYNTRNNYFVLKIKNKGNRKLTIKSAGAYCMDVNYKSYDRKLYLPNYKDITIDAKSSKNIRFYVNGSITWYDYHDFTFRYYFNYDGYQYLCSCWDDNSVYKRGNTWYNTYWD